MVADVIPGPTIKAAFLYRSHIVGNKMVAKIVTFVGRAPQLAGDRVNCLSDTVAKARRIDLYEFSFRCVFQDISPLRGTVYGDRNGVGQS